MESPLSAMHLLTGTIGFLIFVSVLLAVKYRRVTANESTHAAQFYLAVLPVFAMLLALPMLFGYAMTEAGFWWIPFLGCLVIAPFIFFRGKRALEEIVKRSRDDENAGY
jgi:asparagine N-glycosylation enzyme membrane subunit Stt3